MSHNDESQHHKKAKGNDYQLTKLHAISLSGFISQNLIFVYLPYFTLALGASYSQQGIVTSTRVLGSSLTQSFWGSQADKRGRRPILILGYTIIAFTALFYTFSSRISLFLGLLAIQGFCGYALVTGGVWNSTLGDVASERERGTIIGRITSFGVFGSVPVIFLFGYLIDRQELSGPNQYHIAFLAAVVIAIITIILLITLRETLTTKPTEVLPAPWQIIRQNKKFRRFLTLDIVFSFITALTWPLFSFVIKDVVHATNAQLSMIWGFWMAFMAIGQKYGGALSDRLGRRPLMIFCRSTLFLVPLLFALANQWPSWILLLIGQCFGGLGWGLSVLMENMIALDLAPSDQKALFTGTLLTLAGVAGFFGSLVSGVVTQLLSPQYGHIGALILMLYVCVVLRIAIAVVHMFVLEETAPIKRIPLPTFND